MQRKTKKRPDTGALILLPQWAGFPALAFTPKSFFPRCLHSLLRAFFLPAWVRCFLGFQGQGWLVSAPVELLRVGNTCKKSGDSVPVGSPRGSPQFLLLLHGSCLKYGFFKMFSALWVLINSQSSLHWKMCFTFLVSLAGSCSCSGDRDIKGHPEEHSPTSSGIPSHKLSQGCPAPWDISRSRFVTHTVRDTEKQGGKEHPCGMDADGHPKLNSPQPCYCWKCQRHELAKPLLVIK